MSSKNIFEFRSDNDFHLEYEVSPQPLGAGGFGTVFPATRRIDGRKVAVKRVPLRSLPSIRQTPEDNTPVVPKELELLHLAQSCPGVIRLYDSWRDETDLVLVMEYNENSKDLQKCITSNGVMKESEAAHILRQLVKTLQSCQEMNIFHRDIKLENILYDKTTGKTTLIDFGCGELTTSPKQIFKDFQGTLEYVPPEYFLHEAYTPEPSTVWSIGCIAFMMIFGYKPFCNRDDIVRRRVDMDKGIGSMKVRMFILKCLRPLPAERPSLEGLLSNWFLIEQVPVLRAAPTKPEEETPANNKSCRSERYSPVHKQQQSIEQPAESNAYFLPRTENKGNDFLKQICGEVDGNFRHTRNTEPSPPKCIGTSRKRPFRLLKMISCVQSCFGWNQVVQKC